MQVLKAKRSTTAVKKGTLARAEVLDKACRGRLEEELDLVLKSRKKGEGGSDTKLVGALRPLAPLSPSLRGRLAEAVAAIAKRGGSRELAAGSLRTLAECHDPSVPALLKVALAEADGGGSAALSAACFTKDASLSPLLAKLAGSRQSHLAFSAETARVARGESNGQHLAALAPMIKESHRISLCVELFVPLVRGAPVPACIGPALGVLRSAERHLGRWLVLAEVAVKAGDLSPLVEAKQKSEVGPSSARAAWSLVHWALAETAGQAPAEPQVRPTVELVARLSDRPSADRDTTFLFRMARSGAAVTKNMLDSLAKGAPLADEVALRAALHLVRDHGREDLRPSLVAAAASAPKALDVAAGSAPKEELRGVATAALWDAGMENEAKAAAADLLASPVLGNVAWAALVRAAAAHPRTVRAARGNARDAGAGDKMRGEDLVLSEAPLRWIQWGWLE